VIVAALLVLLLAQRTGGAHSSKPESFVVLVLLATLGMMLLISSKDLVALYLAIELISLSLYVMAATGPMAGGSAAYSTEAGLRYFILGALSSGVLLFGCSLIYVMTGQTGYAEIANYSAEFGSASPMGALTESGLAGPAIFILIAILFKLAAAPFHM
jgi:NADH-quinone oxidoreductase subunit N